MRAAGPTRAIVLIDGEHHPAAVRDAVVSLGERHRVVGVVFCGGSEKAGTTALSNPEAHYGFALVTGDDAAAALICAIAEIEAEIVIDLADEPIVTLDQKLRLAAIAVASGLRYETPGMALWPDRREILKFPGPKIAVIGTGKRTGKTAISGHLARLIAAAGGRPAIVSMGRGGPAEPQIARSDTGLAELMELSRQGVHAASDYLEDAVLAGVPTVGARRVGGGPGGESGYTNFGDAARIAAGIDGIDCLLFEGSGASVPPVEADRTICVVGSCKQAEELAGPLRLMAADLVLIPASEAGARATLARWTSGLIVPFAMCAEPAEPLPPEARVAYFSTSPSELTGVPPIVSSANLARRDDLETDLDLAAKSGCTHYVTELKAAAIDSVAMAAEREGAEIVFVRNRPYSEDASLDEILLNLYSCRDPAVPR